MCTRLVIAGWLAWLVVAACGRVGFDQQHASATIDARIAPGVDADPLAPDAPPGAIDAPPAGDGAAACGYISCPAGSVTCCDSGSATCVNTNAPCTRRFECEQPTSTGCTSPAPECCITQDSMGTECIDPATDPCFG